GALAAVGLAAEGRDGRLVYIDEEQNGSLDSGWHDVFQIHQAGVDEIFCVDAGHLITSGKIDIGKKLRPNLSEQRVVLFVEPISDPAEIKKQSETDAAESYWRAIKIR